MKKTTILCVAILFVANIMAQTTCDLQFGPDKTFKIVQFTDTHFDHRSEKGHRTINTMQHAITTEKPDLIILTGDLIESKPAYEALRVLTKPIASSGIPWTVAFGNHDCEFDITKSEMWNVFLSLPGFIGEKGHLSGVGNNMLRLYSSDKKRISNAIFLFDSHDYTHNPVWGQYDWIKFDQIGWYREQSDMLASQNHGASVPAIAFFHIPLKEFNAVSKNVKERVGDKFEGVASSEINSGLFASMMEQGNMMGVFAGHDHDNNYIGIHKDIALGFGQVTGWDAYGRLERGCRVIELHEGKRSFKSWIATPSESKRHIFNYPSGLSDVNDTTKILSAHPVKPTKNGVKYSYFEGKVRHTGDIPTLDKKKSGILNNFTISSAEQEDHFAFIFEAWIDIPKTAFYKFYTYSDDGSVLKIDDTVVVDNDGGHSAKRENGVVALEKGFHKIELLYFEDYMGQVLKVGMASVDILENEIPDEILFVDVGK